MGTPLTPCPFCGGAPEPASEDDDHWCECSVCGACGPAGDTTEEATALWNERVVGRDDHDTRLVEEALHRYASYLARRIQRPNALPEGADTRALERLRRLMVRLGFVPPEGFIAPEGKDFW